jgi:hypothetical protein
LQFISPKRAQLNHCPESPEIGGILCPSRLLSTWPFWAGPGAKNMPKMLIFL